MRLNHSTVQLMEQLNLSGMASAYEQQLNNPDLQSQSFEVRIGLLMEAEICSRNHRKIERLLKNARLRESQASLEDIEYISGRGLDRSVIMGLADCDWLRRRQNLIITGATGTGKTWLACAFGNQACRLGMVTSYWTATDLFSNIILSHADGTLQKLRNQLIKTQLLIVDDLGIGGISSEVGPTLLEVVDRHSRNGSLVITSQYPKEKWHDLFSDPTIADAILDRIIHKSHVIKLGGESMRKIKARK